ncbi:DUF4142 domain-containing protein [Streptomyces mexicanus]|uniref:DUF4142 domain-containing protein n=1 Tax=Streptomyces mexicanus TaxID=178566 RepID=A0A7X1LRV6_9ACTN|nr:DUF4142 domain-containing protein [Streptomyces mexicanus]MBC2867114.1 DUF4142 domain-containing protein [Streptomyces mexicanus]
MRLTRLCGTAAATALLALATAATPASAAPLAGQDSAFLKAVHQSNLAEIAAGQDARSHATSACVKRVADILVRDHTRLDAQGMALARSKGVSLPGTPTAAQRRQLAAVKAHQGTAAYDSAWLEAQEKGHTQTLALIDTELSKGTDAKVRAAARTARPIVAMHLQMVRGGVCHA